MYAIRSYYVDGFRKAHEELRELKEVKFNIADEQIRMTVEKTGMPEEKVKDIINDRFYNFPLKFLRICKKKHIEETIDLLKSEGSYNFV